MRSLVATVLLTGCASDSPEWRKKKSPTETTADPCEHVTVTASPADGAQNVPHETVVSFFFDAPTGAEQDIVPVVADIVAAVSDTLFQVEVTGPIGDPKARFVALPGATGPSQGQPDRPPAAQASAE